MNSANGTAGLAKLSLINMRGQHDFSSGSDCPIVIVRQLIGLIVRGYALLSRLAQLSAWKNLIQSGCS